VKFAVVDIETTGLFHQGHGITEVAVVHVDDSSIKLAYHTLLNPSRRIPKGVSLLTGITNKTTQEAPFFKEIAEELKRAIGDRVFVAHNVNFDYQFLKAAFQEVGVDFRPRRLCTMRLARKVLPGLKSYSLSALCARLGIQNEEVHRAGGDAFATALAFQKLSDGLGPKEIAKLLHARSKNAILPPSITKSKLESIPDLPGIYYFMGRNNKPIYIGKSKNLKSRVLSHFTASGTSAKKQVFQKFIEDIKVVITADEYEASLLEDSEIKKHWPRYNRAQKERAKLYSIIHYKTRNGSLRLGVSTSTRHHIHAIATFHSLSSARNWLYRSLVDSEISPEIAGFAVSDDLVFEGAQSAEERVHEFIRTCKAEQTQSYFLLGGNEQSKYAVAVIKGVYKGFANSLDQIEHNTDWIKERLKPAPDSFTARSIIRQMLADKNVTRLELNQ
jgi:DNA polymerase-3 subunit epsilon